MATRRFADRQLHLSRAKQEQLALHNMSLGRQALPQEIFFFLRKWRAGPKSLLKSHSQQLTAHLHWQLYEGCPELKGGKTAGFLQAVRPFVVLENAAHVNSVGKPILDILHRSGRCSYFICQILVLRKVVLYTSNMHVNNDSYFNKPHTKKFLYLW